MIGVCCICRIGESLLLLATTTIRCFMLFLYGMLGLWAKHKDDDYATVQAPAMASSDVVLEKLSEVLTSYS